MRQRKSSAFGTHSSWFFESRPSYNERMNAAKSCFSCEVSFSCNTRFKNSTVSVSLDLQV